MKHKEVNTINHFFLEIDLRRFEGEANLGLSLGYIFFETVVFSIPYESYNDELCELLCRFPIFDPCRSFLSLFFLAINSFTKALLLSIIFVIFSICLFLTSSLKDFLFYPSSCFMNFLFAVMLNFLLGEPWIDGFTLIFDAFDSLIGYFLGV